MSRVVDRLLSKADELEARAVQINQTRHSSCATKHRRQANLIRELVKEHAPEPDPERPLTICHRCGVTYECRTIAALERCFLPAEPQGDKR